MTTIAGQGGTFRIAALVLAALALSNSGCLLVAAGAAGGAAVGYAYSKGKVCQTYSATFEDTWAAAQAALNDLGMPLVKWEQHAGSGFLESRTADKERVRIYLDAQPSRFPAEGQLTHVGVRVATFGDHPVSVRLLDQVSVHLAPPAVVLPQ